MADNWEQCFLQRAAAFSKSLVRNPYVARVDMSARHDFLKNTQKLSYECCEHLDIFWQIKL